MNYKKKKKKKKKKRYCVGNVKGVWGKIRLKILVPYLIIKMITKYSDRKFYILAVCALQS